MRALLKMNKLIFIFFLGVCLTFVFSKNISHKKVPINSIMEISEESDMGEIEKLTLTTIFDNYQYVKGTKTGWGFSCLVELELDEEKKKKQSILFDTGENGDILLFNIDCLEINPKDFDSIFLSHIHGDHIGGLEKILEENVDVTVFLPSSFPDSLRKKIKSYKAKYKDVKGQEKIYEGIYSTGEMGTFIKEQSLILETKKGLVIITGCAHPGIVDIIKKAKEMFSRKGIYLVMGGFHLEENSDLELGRIIDEFKNLSVGNVAPSHCSGDRTRELFRKEFGDSYIENGVGKKFEI